MIASHEDVLDSEGQALVVGDYVAFEHAEHGVCMFYVCEIDTDSYLFSTGREPSAAIGIGIHASVMWVPPHRLKHVV